MSKHLVAGPPLMLSERKETVYPPSGGSMELEIQQLNLDTTLTESLLWSKMHPRVQLMIDQRVIELIVIERGRLLEVVRELSPEAAEAVTKALAANVTLGRIDAPTKPSGG